MNVLHIDLYFDDLMTGWLTRISGLLFIFYVNGKSTSLKPDVKYLSEARNTTRVGVRCFPFLVVKG